MKPGIDPLSAQCITNHFCHFVGRTIEGCISLFIWVRPLQQLVMQNAKEITVPICTVHTTSFIPLVYESAKWRWSKMHDPAQRIQ